MDLLADKSYKRIAQAMGLVVAEVGSESTLTYDKIRWANGIGLKHRETEDYVGWYTPVLECAYRWGYEGVSLQDAPIVKGYRFGDIPESGVSKNYAAGESEFGLSLAALEGDEPSGAVQFGLDLDAGDRPRVEVEGLLIPETGSDGEPLVLIEGVEDMDN